MEKDNKEKNIIEDEYKSSKFLEKKEKYAKNGFLWQNYQRLIAEEKLYYTEEDKEIIKKLLYNPIPNQFRSEYWFISTGAKLEMENNPGYYQKLVALIPKFRLPEFKILQGDIDRSKMSIEFFKKAENVEIINRILKSFALRNSPSIGYIQGFDILAYYLYSIIKNEEKVFWIFTKIMEDYLPFNFCLDMRGINLYTEMMLLAMEKQIKSLENKILTLPSDFEIILNQGLPSLFANKVDTGVLYNIWDIFFIYGDVTLLKAFYFFASVMIEKKYKNSLFDTVHVNIINRIKRIKCNDLLNYYLLMDDTLNNSYLNEKRKEALNKLNNFVQNEPYEKVVDEGTKCDPTSPYCFYNKIINNYDEFSEYKIFKLKKNTEKNKNYFSDLFNNDKFNDNNGKVIKNETKGDSFDDILVERISHVCTKENQIENK